MANEQGAATVNGHRDSLTGHKRVWVTLITNVAYLPGLLTLDYALKRVKSRYPLVAMYTDSFEHDGHAALDRRRIPKRHTSELLPSVDDIDYGNDPRFRDTWSKLAVFGLEEFDRAVLLDSDMLIRQNLDELMDLELDPPTPDGSGTRLFAAGHVCSCNPMKKPHYPQDWVPSSCAFTAQHADPDAAQTHGGPVELSHGMPNSGLVVANPSRALYEQVLHKLQDEAAVRSYIFPDQNILVDLFKGRWVPLPYVYNALKTMRRPDVHGAIWRDDRVKNVHYIFSPKPWHERRAATRDPLYLWWHDVNDERVAAERAAGLDDGGGGRQGDP